MSFSFSVRRTLIPAALLGGLLGLSVGLRAPAHVFARSTVAGDATGDGQAESFVDDLLKKMTLEEKIGQMSQMALNTPDRETRDERDSQGSRWARFSS